MARSTLWQETAETIRAFLDGRLARKEAEAWATNVIAAETFLSDELVLEQAVLTLLELQDPRVSFATAQQDLEHLPSCLLGTQGMRLAHDDTVTQRWGSGVGTDDHLQGFLFDTGPIDLSSQFLIIVASLEGF